MPREYWFLIDQLVIGGAQRQLTVLALGLHARGHRVRVDALRDEGPFIDELRRGGVEVHAVARGSESVVGHLVRYVRDARHRRPAVIHSYLPAQNALVALMKPLLGPTRIVWGVRVGLHDTTHYGLRGRVAYRLERVLARIPDLTIVNSQVGRDVLLGRGHRRDRVMVIPNGVDTELFRADPGARERQRRAWGVGESEVLIGTVGRIDPAKDHDTFLRAMALVDDERARFVCVGGGTDAAMSALRSRAAQLQLDDRLILAGDVEDMPAAYNALDVFCLTSRNEALPNALLEAMAVGLPCVSTNAGDVAQALGDLGYVVPIGDARAVADACRLALHDDRTVQRRSRVLDTYSREALLDRTSAALEAIGST